MQKKKLKSSCSSKGLFSIAYINEFPFRPLFFYVNLLFKLKIADLLFIFYFHSLNQDIEYIYIYSIYMYIYSYRRIEIDDFSDKTHFTLSLLTVQPTGITGH